MIVRDVVFYVCRARAMKDLLVVLFASDVAIAHSRITSLGLFLVHAIILKTRLVPTERDLWLASLLVHSHETTVGTGDPRNRTIARMYPMSVGIEFLMRRSPQAVNTLAVDWV